MFVQQIYVGCVDVPNPTRCANLTVAGTLPDTANLNGAVNTPYPSLDWAHVLRGGMSVHEYGLATLAATTQSLGEKVLWVWFEE